MKTKSKAIVKRKQRKQGKVKVSRKKKGSRKRQKGGKDALEREVILKGLNPGTPSGLKHSPKTDGQYRKVTEIEGDIASKTKSLNTSNKVIKIENSNSTYFDNWRPEYSGEFEAPPPSPPMVNKDMLSESFTPTPAPLAALARSRKAREDAGQKTITKTVILKHAGQGEKKNWGLHFKPGDINGMVLRSNDIDSIEDVSYASQYELGADDRIIEVNGVSLSNFNKDEIKLLIIEASKGTTVEFKVIPRKFQPITVTLTYIGKDKPNPDKQWGLITSGFSDKNTENKGIFFKQIRDKTTVKITGELHPGYRIIEINEKSLLNSPPKKFVMDRLKEARKGETIILKVLPTELQSRTVTLTYNPDPAYSKKDWGLEVDVSVSDKNTENKGIFFKTFIDENRVTITGELQQGDRIIEINGKSLLNLLEPEITNLLEEAQKGETIKLKVLPDAFQSSPQQPTGNSQSSA